jgi:hypothetical protein
VWFLTPADEPVDQYNYFGKGLAVLGDLMVGYSASA